MMPNDLMLDNDGDLLFENGDLVIGESTMQDVSIILQTAQGEHKEFPLMGANQVREIRGTNRALRRERIIREQMEMDDKDYEEIKDHIKLEL